MEQALAPVPSALILNVGALTIGAAVEAGRTVSFQVRDALTAASDLDQLLAVFGTVSGIDPVGGAVLFSCNGRGAASSARPIMM